MSIDVQVSGRGSVHRYDLVVDGHKVTDVQIWGVPNEIILNLRRSETAELLLERPLEDILRSLHVLEVDGSLIPNTLRGLEKVRFGRDPFELRVDFDVEPEEWKGEWSIREYVAALDEAVSAADGLKFNIGGDPTE